MRRSGPSERSAFPAGGLLAGKGLRAGRWVLLPLAWLLLAGGAGGLALLGWRWLPYLVGGGLALAWLAWVLLSTMTPGKVDRRCPRCGQERLRPLRPPPSSPLGVICAACGFRDEAAHVPGLDQA